MTAAKALRAARAAGVKIALNGNDLVLKDSSLPPDDVLEALSHNKAGVIAILRAGADDWPPEEWQALYDERAGIGEFDGGLSRDDAEHLAAQCQGYNNVVAFKSAEMIRRAK